MQPAFLLIAGENASLEWLELLRKTLAPFGALQTLAAAPGPDPVLDPAQWIGIILDAGIAEDPAVLTARLKLRYPELPVVVFSAVPTLDQLRDALRAGAADYLPKAMPETDLCTALTKDFDLQRPD